MNYYPNCENIEAYSCGNCTPELGRIRSVALIHKSYFSTLIADPESYQLWYDGRVNGKIFVYPKVQGEYDGGSPQMGTGWATSPETLLAYFFTAKIKEPNYLSNVLHWNSIKGSKNYYVAFCSESIMQIPMKVCNIIPRNSVANDLKTEVVWEVDLKWTDFNLPMQYTIPSNVFDCDIIVPIVCDETRIFDCTFDLTFN
jgi:hypothetical protein